MTQQRRILSFTFSAAALPLLPSSEPVWLLFPNYRVRNGFRRHSMTQSSKILWFTFCVAALLLLPSRVAAQSGTVTDDGFLSTNSTTQQLNLNGQGISLIVVEPTNHRQGSWPNRLAWT